VLKNFLSQAEVSSAQDEVENVILSSRETACVRPHNTLLPLRWNDAVVELFLQSQRRVQVLQDAVGAKDLKWISGYVSIKEPQSGALWWHQDWWCWQHPASFQKPASQIAVMCYLTSTTTQTGALRVLPHSHHKSSPLHAFLPEAHARAAHQIAPDPVAMNDHPDQTTLNLEAGDAVAIDYRLLHGTHPNASLKRRDCVLLTFTPSWCDLPDDLKGHLISHQAFLCDEGALSAAQEQQFAELKRRIEKLRPDLERHGLLEPRLDWSRTGDDRP